MPIMPSNSIKLDEIRENRSELENHYIDELVSGRISRRDFVRKGAVVGMSSSLLAAVLSACGGANSSSKTTTTTAATGTPKQGGTLHLAQQAPSAAINPLTIADSGGLNMLAQTGDFLILDNNQLLTLQPMLATSWTPSNSGAVWTFKLRPNVKFHNGQPFTAKDVVYTFKQLADPKNASNALSTFTSVLTPDGVVMVDPMTVAFHLESPNGNFPYLVSSDNYNAIIVPDGTDFSKWQKHVHRDRPVHAQELHAERRRLVRRQPQLLGAVSRTSTARRSRSTRASRLRSSRSRAARSTGSCSSRPRAPSRC